MTHACQLPPEDASSMRTGHASQPVLFATLKAATQLTVNNICSKEYKVIYNLLPIFIAFSLPSTLQSPLHHQPPGMHGILQP